MAFRPRGTVGWPIPGPLVGAAGRLRDPRACDRLGGGEWKGWEGGGWGGRGAGQRNEGGSEVREEAATPFGLGWLMGAYRMTRYRSAAPAAPRAMVVAPPEADLAYAEAAASANSF